MSYESKNIGKVENKEQLEKEVPISTAVLIMGGAVVGAYVGLHIGGPVGAAVGALIGAFVGALTAGLIKNFKIKLHKDGSVEASYETRFE